MHKKKITLRSFKAKFWQLIDLPAFGEPRHSTGDKESSARKELRKTGLLRVLKSDDFCKTILCVSQKWRRLEAERVKVPLVARRMRPVILRYHRAIKRLESCVLILSEFEKNDGELFEHATCHKIVSAIALITEVQSEVDRRRGILVSNVHLKLRRKYDVTSDWELLFKEYDYDLEKLGIKAADQWFISNVNYALLAFIEWHKIQSISDMTRFKLIAAISEAADYGRVLPTTIKQFFVEHPNQR